jgi:hypothetical protein
MRIGVITLTLAFSMALAFLVVGAFPPVSGAGPCDDSDGDGVCLQDDNCSAVANASQTDTNSDGYGNACDSDSDNNNAVGQSDLTALKGAWLCTATMGCYNADLDTDEPLNNAIGQSDLTALKGVWLGAPGPSGLSCAGTIPCPGGGPE